MEIQVAVLWAVQNNYFDDVAVDQVKDFQGKLTDFLTMRKADLLVKIHKEKAISDGLAGELKAAITEFKQTYDAGRPKVPVTQAKPAEPAGKQDKSK